MQEDATVRSEDDAVSNFDATTNYEDEGRGKVSLPSDNDDQGVDEGVAVTVESANPGVGAY